MEDQISEREILNLLKQLEHGSLLQDQEGQETSFSVSHSMSQDTKMDGFVKVEDGKVIIGASSYGGKIPTLKAIHPVKLFVNGEEVIKETKCLPESIIEWTVDEKPLYEISVSEDKMEAYITINRTQRHAWKLADIAPATDVTLHAKEDTTIILEKIYLQNVHKAIDQMNIKMNLDMIAIQIETLQPSCRPTLIAKGLPPVQGQDAKLELFFSENIENIFTEVMGVIDFKNHMNIPSVKSGDAIAKKTRPVEGQAGYDVFGHILLPNPVKDVLIVGKDTVEVTSDFIVIARKEGRPRITGNQIKYFDINTAYVVPGNVDIETGNIVFAGDVIVYGDVMDNMIIESLGSIYIVGSVFNSTLTATGSITVKGNVMGSNLYSGYFGMLYNRLYYTSKELMDIVEKMMESAKLVTHEFSKKNKQVRYGQVLLLLVESKYQKIWDVVKELLGVISSLQSFSKNTLNSLKTYLELFPKRTSMIESLTAPRMEDLKRVLKEAFMSVVLSQEARVQININNGQNSTLKSNGDILIRKDGVIHCNLYSARNIVFFLDNSVCRGSKLEAGDTISAMYVGGMTGVTSSLKAKNKVVVKEMYEGRVMVDRHSLDIFEPVQEKTFDRNSMR